MVSIFSPPLTSLSFIGTYVCAEPACKQRTRQLSVNSKCVNGACKGKLSGEVTERQANDTIRYLCGLFDVEKYKQENPSKKAQEFPNGEVPHQDTFLNLKQLVDTALDRSKYNKVDLNELFSFMDAK